MVFKISLQDLEPYQGRLHFPVLQGTFIPFEGRGGGRGIYVQCTCTLYFVLVSADYYGKGNFCIGLLSKFIQI